MRIILLSVLCTFIAGCGGATLKNPPAANAEPTAAERRVTFENLIREGEDLITEWDRVDNANRQESNSTPVTNSSITTSMDAVLSSLTTSIDIVENDLPLMLRLVQLMSSIERRNITNKTQETLSSYISIGLLHYVHRFEATATAAISALTDNTIATLRSSLMALRSDHENSSRSIAVDLSGVRSELAQLMLVDAITGEILAHSFADYLESSATAANRTTALETDITSITASVAGAATYDRNAPNYVRLITTLALKLEGRIFALASSAQENHSTLTTQINNLTTLQNATTQALAITSNTLSALLNDGGAIAAAIENVSSLLNEAEGAFRNSGTIANELSVRIDTALRDLHRIVQRHNLATMYAQIDEMAVLLRRLAAINYRGQAIALIEDLLFIGFHAESLRMNSVVTSHTSSIVTINSRLSAFDANFSAFASTINRSIAFVEAELDELKQTISSQNTTLNNRINALETALLSELDARISALESSLTATDEDLQTQIAALQSIISSLTAKPATPTGSPTTLTGTAADGLVIDGLVKAYTTNDDCSPGEVISSGRTDEEGNFALPTYDLRSQTIIFTVEEGYYVEEATGERVDLRANQKLYAIGNVTITSETRQITRTISGATNLQYAYVCYERNVRRTDLLNSINSAVAKSTIFLGAIDPFNTVYHDVRLAKYNNLHFNDSTYRQGFWYSMYVAGISGMVYAENIKQGTNFHSLDFWLALARDIRADGVFNGVGEQNTVIALGGRPLNRNMVQTEAMRAAHQFISSSFNRVIFNEADITALEGRINGVHISGDPIWGTAPLDPLDNAPPTIIPPTLLGAFASTRVDVVIRDNEGVDQVLYRFNNGSQLALPRATNNVYRIPIDYDNLATGVYPLTLTASDAVGNTSTAALSLQIVKDAPRITINPYPPLVNRATTITGTIELLYPAFTELASFDVLVNEKTETPTITSNTFSFVTIFQNGGALPIDINACDNIGNCSAVNSTINVDVASPEISDVRVPANRPAWTLYPGRESISTGNSSLDIRDYLLSFFTLEQGMRAQRLDNGFLYTGGNEILTPTEITEQALDGRSIHYFVFDVIDNRNSDIYTEAANLVVYATYSTGNYSIPPGGVQADNPTLTVVRASSFTLSDRPSSGGRKRIIYPLVIETLGAGYTQESMWTDHVLQFRVCDAAGNCAEQGFMWSAAFDILEEASISPVHTTTPALTFATRAGLSGTHRWHSITIANNNDIPIEVKIDSATTTGALRRRYHQKTVNPTTRWRKYTQTAALSCSDPREGVDGPTTPQFGLILTPSATGDVITQLTQPAATQSNMSCQWFDANGRVDVYWGGFRYHFANDIANNCDVAFPRVDTAIDGLTARESIDRHALFTDSMITKSWTETEQYISHYVGQDRNNPVYATRNVVRSCPSRAEYVIQYWNEIPDGTTRSHSVAYTSQYYEYAGLTQTSTTQSFENTYAVSDARFKHADDESEIIDYVAIASGEQLRVDIEFDVPRITQYEDPDTYGQTTALSGTYRHDYQQTLAINSTFVVTYRSENQIHSTERNVQVDIDLVRE